MPFFSIVVPTYNRGERIFPTLDSVLAQTDGDFELLVVDDGSKDDTLAILHRYADRAADRRVRVVSRVNGGTTAARNTGIGLATGQFILPLDHDDFFLPWTLATHRAAIKDPASVAFSAGTVVVADPKTVQRRDLKTQRLERLFDLPVEQMPIYPSGWAIRADVLRSVEGFFHFNQGYEDLDLLLRIGVRSGFVRVDEPVIAVRGEHESNLSSARHIPWFVKGLQTLFDREQTGEYPGGKRYAKIRRGIISATSRTISVACARSGLASEALLCYRRSFFWNLRRARLKYLLGLPLMVVSSKCRKPSSLPTSHK